MIFGKVAPIGRLSQAFPRNVGQLPLRTEDLPTGRPQMGAGVDIAGDTELDREGHHVFRKFTTATILEGAATPLFPAGHGLTYTDFAYGPLRVGKTMLQGEADLLEVAVSVTNSGPRAGSELVQLYLRDPVATISRPVRELKGFQRLDLAPGETGEATFAVTTEELKFWTGPTIADARQVWEPGAFDIMVGPDAERVQTVRVTWQK